MATVGITYDLRQHYLELGFGEEETAEFDRPETIDAIDEALQQLGYATDRIGHILSLTRRLAAGDRWDMVFNIAEGLRGFGREAQVPALLDAFDIPYTFSDPLVLSLTLHKGMTKRVIRDLGIPTPDFAVVEREVDAGEDRPPSSPLCQARGGRNRQGHQRLFQDRDAEGSGFALREASEGIRAAGAGGDLPAGP